MAPPRSRPLTLRPFLAITLILWVVVVAPLCALLAWLIDYRTAVSLLIGLLATPLVTLWMWHAIQSADPILRWPAMQLLGWTGVLMSVTLCLAPLLWLLPRPTVGLIALICWLLLSVYGVWLALNIRETQLAFSDQRIDKKYKFVHITDVHAGSRSRKFIEKVTAQVLRHRPDGVFITGDLIDSSVVDQQFLSPLAALQCPVWLCIGNHERYVDLPAALRAIEANGIQVLRNQSVEFGPFRITGIDDADNPKQVATQLINMPLAPNKYGILLYHRPDGWPAARDAGIDLTLAGHTHAGQVWPFGLLVQRQFPRMAGLFTEAGKSLFVSRGTGTWGPIMRLGTFCEMTIISINRAN